ncbi:DUF6624 domain-containing protein [Amycolatopsis sacchari]|uniref:DUF6624 domain-containing protein n=1 Tax=Amycolatopsis sacchari TaxID=115433 RepID=UPI003EBD022E
MISADGGQAQEDSMIAKPRRPDLRAELIARAEVDQDARRTLGDPPTSEQWDLVKAVDADNSAWLEDIIAGHGWPGADMVCEDGAHAAWLLAQHAPLHLQQRWLPLLGQAVEAGEAAAVDLAYLDDRVRIREQRPQRHGTQWLVRGGEQRLFPLDEPDQVNHRRAALGLPLLATREIADAWPASTDPMIPDIST